jgi:mannose-6-phosphate isomerase-like protein (cupin superfamily)
MADTVATVQRTFNIREEIEKGGFVEFEPQQFDGYWVKFLGYGGVSDPERKIWKHMINIAYLEPGKTKVHAHPAENVLYVLEGEGLYVSHENPREETPVKAGDLCIALGNQDHGFLNTGNTRMYYLAIEGPVDFGTGRPRQ